MEPVLASSVLNAERSQLSGWHAVVCFALLCFALLCLGSAWGMSGPTFGFFVKIVQF